MPRRQGETSAVGGKAGKHGDVLAKLGAGEMIQEERTV